MNHLDLSWKVNVGLTVTKVKWGNMNKQDTIQGSVKQLSRPKNGWSNAVPDVVHRKK